MWNITPSSITIPQVPPSASESMMCCKRELFHEHYRRAVEFTEKEGFKSRYGFSPPKGLPDELRVGSGHRNHAAEFPSIDIRHAGAFTMVRMSPEQFRSARSRRGWTEAEEVPGWGRTFGRFSELLEEVKNGYINI